jgi:hypothetical protein
MHWLRVCAIALVASGCGDRGAVTFSLKVPANALFNPVAQPELVTEYDVRTASGTVIGIASAVQGSAQNGGGLLPLGALMTTTEPQDVFVTALSGGNLVGEARIRDVVVKGGARATYDAELRKPLVFVGSAIPAESDPGNKTARVQILDPNASSDLAKTGSQPPNVAGGMTAGAVSWDGRFLFAANGAQLAVFDTGLGTNVGSTLTLPFSPTRLAVAPRDRALVALDPGSGSGSDGAIAIAVDVGKLAQDPAGAQVKTVRLPGQIGRAVAFARDGNTAFVLTGGAIADPCSPGAMPAANAIVALGLDGTNIGTFTLPGFASDLTVDPATGLLVLTDATRGQIATLDLSNAMPGNVTPARVLAGLTCPSAVRVVNGVAFVVTSDRDANQANAFMLQRVNLGNQQATALPFAGPTYSIPIVSSPSQDGNIQTLGLQVRPGSIEAYELAITPDGARAEFATRAHYKETATQFTVSTQQCMATFDIVEYGLYAVDIRTGNASYAMRSQEVVVGQNGCITCSLQPGVVVCQPAPGDRPAGLTAAFGQ